MNWLEALLLGIIQGLTEFIPVSSSGHLVIAHELFGASENNLAFDVALHGGTLLALIIFFNKDLLLYGKALFVKGAKTRLSWLLLMATIPAVIAGVLLQNLAETTFRSPLLVSISLIVVALLMFLAEKVASKKSKKTELESIGPKQALAIGVAQAIAIIPGVSRSGATITTGLFADVDRVAATRFSFLLGIPIITGAIVKVTLSGEALGQFSEDWAIFLIGIISAFISGLFAIKFLLRYLSKHSLAAFAYYRIVLGVGLLLLFSL